MKLVTSSYDGASISADAITRVVLQDFSLGSPPLKRMGLVAFEGPKSQVTLAICPVTGEPGDPELKKLEGAKATLEKFLTNGKSSGTLELAVGESLDWWNAAQRAALFVPPQPLPARTSR